MLVESPKINIVFNRFNAISQGPRKEGIYRRPVGCLRQIRYFFYRQHLHGEALDRKCRPVGGIESALCQATYPKRTVLVPLALHFSFCLPGSRLKSIEQLSRKDIMPFGIDVPVCKHYRIILGMGPPHGR
jgi:hypothetical protein